MNTKTYKPIIIPCTGYIISINKNSILNAPNIELL